MKNTLLTVLFTAILFVGSSAHAKNREKIDLTVDIDRAMQELNMELENLHIRYKQAALATATQWIDTNILPDLRGIVTVHSQKFINEIGEIIQPVDYFTLSIFTLEFLEGIPTKYRVSADEIKTGLATTSVTSTQVTSNVDLSEVHGKGQIEIITANFQSRVSRAFDEFQIMYDLDAKYKAAQTKESRDEIRIQMLSVLMANSFGLVKDGKKVSGTSGEFQVSFTRTSDVILGQITDPKISETTTKEFHVK